MNDPHDDAALRFALRGLRQDIPPQQDLWPGIARAIHAHGRARRGPTRWWPLALAASVMVVAGLAWRLDPTTAPPAVQAEVHGPAALALDAEYRAALAQVQGIGRADAIAPGLRALDDGLAQIHAALRHDPDSRLLLEQLRRIYLQRLALLRLASVV